MSKLIMYEWQCEHCEHQFDELEHSNVFSVECHKCGKQSKRLISTPRLDWRNMGLDAAGCPTAAARWAKAHEQAKKVDEKRAKDHGPDTWGSSGGDVRR